MTREEAIQILSTRDWSGMLCGYTGGYQEAYDMAIESLQREEHLVELEAKAVAIIKSERHGEWVAAHIGETTSWYVECSECHVVMPPVHYGYCPNCGAKMDKE